MGIIDGFGDILFGSAPSTVTVAPEDKIAPADATEQGLYDQLGALNTGNLDYASYLSGDRQGLFDTTMANMGDWNQNLQNLSYDGQLNPEMQNQLMEMYQAQLGNIDSYTNTGVGEMMNQMSNRGIINSSTTGRAFGDIANQANTQKNDAYSNYLNQQMQAFNNQYNADYNKMVTEGSALTNQYGFLDSAYQSAYADPYNMWSNIRDDRYGLTTDTIMQPATSGLMGDLIQGGSMLASASMMAPTPK